MATIPVPSGINAIPLAAIPEKWDRQWFQHFINTQLALMDVRNAVAGTGITITDSAGNPPTASKVAKITAVGGNPTLAALSVEGNPTNAPAIGTSIAASGASQFLQTDSTGTTVTWGAAPGAATQLRGATWTGGNAPILPQNMTDVSILIPQDSTVNRCTILTKSNGGAVGNCQVDIWTSPIAAYPPTGSNSICGGNLPTITAGNDYDSTTLTGWNTTLPKGNVVTFHLVSSLTFSEIIITIALQPANTVASNGYTNAQAVAAVAAALANTGNIAFTYAGGAISANTAGATANSWSQSLTANGYQKFPSGFIIQWGSFTLPSAGATSVTFPLTFPNNCFSVVPTQGQSTSYGYPFSVASKSTTGFTADGSAVGGILAGTGYWVAFGN
jgi:hypothetical protein